MEKLSIRLEGKTQNTYDLRYKKTAKARTILLRNRDEEEET